MADQDHPAVEPISDERLAELERAADERETYERLEIASGASVRALGRLSIAFTEELRPMIARIRQDAETIQQQAEAYGILRDRLGETRVRAMQAEAEVERLRATLDRGDGDD